MTRNLERDVSRMYFFLENITICWQHWIEFVFRTVISVPKKEPSQTRNRRRAIAQRAISANESNDSPSTLFGASASPPLSRFLNIAQLTGTTSDKRALAIQSRTLKMHGHPISRGVHPIEANNLCELTFSPNCGELWASAITRPGPAFHQIAITPPHQERMLLRSIPLTVPSQNCNFFIKIQGVVRSNFKFWLVFQPLLNLDFAEVKTVYIYKRKLVAQNHVLAGAKKWLEIREKMAFASISFSQILQFVDGISFKIVHQLNNCTVCAQVVRLHTFQYS